MILLLAFDNFILFSFLDVLIVAIYWFSTDVN